VKMMIDRDVAFVHHASNDDVGVGIVGVGDGHHRYDACADAIDAAAKSPSFPENDDRYLALHHNDGYRLGGDYPAVGSLT
jgi:hypothetical protein